MRHHDSVLLVVLCLVACADTQPGPDADASSTAIPNDNRVPAGTLRSGVLELDLEARLAGWPGEGSDSVVAVAGFAEAGGPVTIPGPLIRVPEGTEVHVRVRNALPDTAIRLGLPSGRSEGIRSLSDTVLIVRGLRAGTVANDSLHIALGEVREVRYRADVPGTYLYWATASPRRIDEWTGRDAQLAGAIIVDPAGVMPDPEERIFVITMLDQLPDSLQLSQDDIFRRAINGVSWPHTERLHYTLGDTVRWRLINASGEVHPMHLHGFHYRILAKGDGTTDTTFAANERRLAVTEHMEPGSTFRMEWVPARAGNWIFHCHVLDHITPVVVRDDSIRGGDLHDVEQHALDAMAGLVLGMTVSEADPATEEASPAQRLRLVAREQALEDETWRRGFALQDGMEPGPDSIPVPGPPLLLTRGGMTEITVVNRLTEPTTVHWHGLELASVYDGVAGWSRTGPRIAPLIAPGDSFVVRIAPPRAGTFIYHTHMDETDQLAQGLIGPFIVLEPGEAFDPETDRIFVFGGQEEGDYPISINGEAEPGPAMFRTGAEYRLRFINITRGTTLDLVLQRDGVPLTWRPAARDGAELPPALRSESAATLRSNTGATFDFLWTAENAGDALLEVRYTQAQSGASLILRKTFRVR